MLYKCYLITESRVSLLAFRTVLITVSLIHRLPYSSSHSTQAPTSRTTPPRANTPTRHCLFPHSHTHPSLAPSPSSLQHPSLSSSSIPASGPSMSKGYSAAPLTESSICPPPSSRTTPSSLPAAPLTHLHLRHHPAIIRSSSTSPARHRTGEAVKRCNARSAIATRDSRTH